MDEPIGDLPWEALAHTEGPIPWEALEQFAQALAADPAVTEGLIELYHKHQRLPAGVVSYVSLYVPVIFRLAAPLLNDRQRDRIMKFLLAELVLAGREDGDVELENLTAACGALGPAIVPHVLALIEAEPDTWGAWIFLWSLTKLAAQSEDAQLREQVITACVGCLEEVRSGKLDMSDGVGAVWALAGLGYTGHRDLLAWLVRKSSGSLFWHGDYREALDRLDGHPQHGEHHPECWECPLRERLASHWKVFRDWYARRGWEEPDQAELDAIDDADDDLDDLPRIPIVEPIRSASAKVGRNEPCPCGSGRKYKKCCGRPGPVEAQPPAAP